jgi:hypothetical protein
MTYSFVDFFSLAIYVNTLFFGSTQHELHPVSEKYLVAVGGKEKWQKVKSLEMEYEVLYVESKSQHLATSTKSSYLKILQKGERYFSERASIAEGKRRMIYNGKQLIEINPQGNKFVSQAESEIVIEHKRRTFHYGAPWVVIHSEKMEYLGEETVNDIPCQVLEVTYRGLAKKYYIRNDNHLLLMTSMFDGITKTYFSNYSEIQGYNVPHFTSSYINGQLEIETELKRIVYNGTISDSIFEVDQ